jgi:hypothetical protein
MTEDTVIRQELDRFVAGLLAGGLASGWIGLELMTLGMTMLTSTMGRQKLAEHFRRIADQLEGETEPARADQGYSALG